jgi:hypothetical protein
MAKRVAPKVEAPVADLPGAGLSPLEFAALKIAAKESAKHRTGLGLGKEQAVDVVLRIRGTVDVNPDSTATVREYPKAAALLTTLFLLTPAADRGGLARRLARRYKAGMGKTKPAEEAGIKELVDNLLASLAVQSSQDKEGAVTGRIEIAKV